jgi:hypothetical protein
MDQDLPTISLIAHIIERKIFYTKTQENNCLQIWKILFVKPDNLGYVLGQVNLNYTIKDSQSEHHIFILAVHSDVITLSPLYN